jgi:YD repeat-containing protein
LSRVTNTTLPDPDGTGPQSAPEITRAWDHLGRLTTLTDPLGNVTTYDYDITSRLIQRTDPDPDGAGALTSPVTQWAYDDAGQLTSITDPLGQVTTYAYDNLGRMTHVQQVEPASGNSVAEKRVDFAYNAAGQYESITRWMDITQTVLVAATTFAYDDAHRLTGLSHDQGLTNLADYAWTYDTSGRITSVTTLDGTDDFTYDDTGQLTGVDSDYQANETYDANGNRTNSGYVTGDNNQTTDDGTYTYQYDNEGNRTRKTTKSTGAYVEYEWDHRNRLTRVEYRTSGGTLTKAVEYDYDHADRRIAKRVDDNADSTWDDQERFVYDGEDLTMVYDETGTPAFEGRYLHGPGIDTVLGYWQPGQNIRWTFTDRLGRRRDQRGRGPAETAAAGTGVPSWQNPAKSSGLNGVENF